MPKRSCKLVRRKTYIALQNSRFSLALRTAGRAGLAHFMVSSSGDGRYDIETDFDLWTGFYGITSHTHDLVFSTETCDAPAVEVLRDDTEAVSVRTSPMMVQGWEVSWTVEMDDEALYIEPQIHVHRNTFTDNEVYELAFETNAPECIKDVVLDSNFIVPPREWFQQGYPTITYKGNFARSSYDQLRRWRFSGLAHDSMDIYFTHGFGLRLSCESNSSFKVLRTPVKLPVPAYEYQYKSFERFGMGTPYANEKRHYYRDARLGCCVKITYREPAEIATLDVRTGSRRFDRLVRAYHKSHAHSTQRHRWGLDGGCHHVQGTPGVESHREGGEYADTKSYDGVTFEYFMHGPPLRFSVLPGVTEQMHRAIESAHSVTFPDGMVESGHALGQRGMFYEVNPSMILFTADYVKRTGDLSVLPAAERWLGYLLSQTTDKPFLFKTPNSTGISGHGNGAYISNWWDVIPMCGYDAYINALYYGAVVEMAKMEEAAGDTDEAKQLRRLCRRMHRDYNDLFWNRHKKRYVGWVDTAGGEHDAYYTFVQLLAMYYGLTSARDEKALLRKLDSDIRKCGYRDFSLPCNLLPIPPDDYNGGDWWAEEFGFPHFYDPFGTYENGGVWIWLSAYYMACWGRYDASRAYKHMVAILDEYDRSGLYGYGNGHFWDPATGKTRDGSKQEPYLANTVMSVWGLLTLFGVEQDIARGLFIRPNLPREMADSTFGLIYHGSRIRVRYHGWGGRVRSLRIGRQTLDPTKSVPRELISDGITITCEMATKSK